MNHDSQQDANDGGDYGPHQCAARESVYAFGQQNRHVGNLDPRRCRQCTAAQRVAGHEERVHDGDRRRPNGHRGQLHPGQDARRRADQLSGLVVLNGPLSLRVARTGHARRDQIVANVGGPEYGENRLQSVHHYRHGAVVGFAQNADADEDQRQ